MTVFVQVKEKAKDLARLETLDMGKPISEAEWDMVRLVPSHDYMA
jgi:acyl-CoA reductase-like NAD-dependent aldehyde dehydrogenase